MVLKKLDWYIIKKYLSTFFFTMFLITLIAVTINYFEQVDKFLNANLTTSQVIFEYYIYFIPWINGLLWPLFALLAVIFFTSRMAKNSEIISILSAGVSYKRFLLPYLIGAGILATLLWVGNNFVIPKSNLQKNEFESKYIKASAKQSRTTNIHLWLSQNDKIYIRNYNTRDSSGRTFRLEKFNENKELIYVLKSNRIVFQKMTNSWRLDGYEIRKYNDLKELIINEPTKKLDTVLQFMPSDFTRYTRQMDVMNTLDLREYIVNEQNRGLDSGKSFVIELYRRTADPFTIFILTLIGVSVSSRKVRGGMGFHLAIGIVIGAVFVILSKFSTTFSINLSLPPAIGVWIPNIFFSAIAYYLLRTAQK